MNTNTERYELNKQLAQMLKGGVIMDVTTPEQAKIAEEAGACAVMALERIPAEIRAAGGVSSMSDPKMIKGIQEAVSIPVMAKCRIGHFVEAQILEAIEIDYIDAVSYTHLTLPTKRIVEISVVPGSLKKKKKRITEKIRKIQQKRQTDID